jgi:hypothetical protein
MILLFILGALTVFGIKAGIWAAIYAYLDLK